MHIIDDPNKRSIALRFRGRLLLVLGAPTSLERRSRCCALMLQSAAAVTAWGARGESTSGFDPVTSVTRHVRLHSFMGLPS